MDTLKFSAYLDGILNLCKLAEIKNTDFTNHVQIKLTKREHEIVFLLGLGKSQKEIAYILQTIHHTQSPTSSTIASVMQNQLYKKFDVTDISSLIEKTAALGYLDTIPDSFFLDPEREYE